MKTQLATIDLVVLATYGVAIFSLAQFVSRSKRGESKNAADYFSPPDRCHGGPSAPR